MCSDVRALLNVLFSTHHIHTARRVQVRYVDGGGRKRRRESTGNLLIYLLLLSRTCNLSTLTHMHASLRSAQR